MRFSFTLVLLTLVLSACSKDPAPVVAPDPGGSWTLDAQTTVATVSDVSSRKGFLLTFSDRSTVNQLSFLFRSRPVVGGRYRAATDTAIAGAVAVTALVDAHGYHVSAAAPTYVEVVVNGGKLHLNGTAIPMDSDSNGRGAASLSFDVRQY